MLGASRPGATNGRREPSPRGYRQAQLQQRRARALAAARRAESRRMQEVAERKRLSRLRASVERVLRETKEEITWPTGRRMLSYLSLRDAATDYAQQWDAAVSDVIVDGTSHMRRAIEVALAGVADPEL